MAGLTNKSGAKQPTTASSLQFQTAQRGSVIPLVYGTTRIAPNLLDYDDFKSQQVKDTPPHSGKGGAVGGGSSKGGSSSTTIFSASFILGLCQGPIIGFGAAYYNKNITTVAALPNLSSANLGADGQIVDPYWESVHSGKAIGYSGIANLVFANFSLGTSATLPNFTIEVSGILAGTAIDGLSADPSQIVVDFLTNPRYGADFPPAHLADIINGPYGRYVRALGLWLSYSMETQQSAQLYLAAIAKLTNSAVVWSGGQLNMLPYGDQPIVGSVTSSAAWTVRFTGPSAGSSTFTVFVSFSDPSINGGATVTASGSGTDVPTVAQQLSGQISLVAGPAYGIVVTSASILQGPAPPNVIPSDICQIALLQQPPLGTTTVSASGADILAGIAGGTGSFTPNNQAVYSLDDDDFIVQATSTGGASGPNPGSTGLHGGSGAVTGGFSGDPVHVARSTPADAINKINLEVVDRNNWYNAAPVEAADQNAIDLYGQRQESSVDGHAITDPGYVGYTVAQLLLQRDLLYRNTYTFQLGWKYCLLEPMDLVQITDAKLGITALTVRITAIQEDDEGTLTVTAEDFFGAYNPVVLYPRPGYIPPLDPTILGLGGASAPGRPPQLGVGGSIQNTNLYPGDINTPIIFQPPAALLSTSGQEIWVALSGATPNWGGAQVWVSSDGNSYGYAGSVFGAATMGVTTADLPAYGGANPDMTDILSVDLRESGGTLVSRSAIDAANLVSLFYVGRPGVPGEMLSYQNATLLSAGRYNLTTLYRGAYSTPVADHPPGSGFSLINAQIGHFPFPATVAGQIIYLKFLSFNQTGSNVQNIAYVPVYSYTIV